MPSTSTRLAQLEKHAAAVLGDDAAEPLVVICVYVDDDGTETESWRLVIPEPEPVGRR